MSTNKIWNLALAATVATTILATSVSAGYCDSLNSPSTCRQEGCRWSALIDTCLPSGRITAWSAFGLVLSALEKLEEEEKEQEAALFTQLLSESFDEESFDEESNTRNGAILHSVLQFKNPRHHAWKKAGKAVLDEYEDDQDEEQNSQTPLSGFITNHSLSYKPFHVKHGKVAGFDEDDKFEEQYQMNSWSRGGSQIVEDEDHHQVRTDALNRLSTWDEGEGDEVQWGGPRQIKDGIILFKDTNPFLVKGARFFEEDHDLEQQQRWALVKKQSSRILNTARIGFSQSSGEKSGPLEIDPFSGLVITPLKLEKK